MPDKVAFQGINGANSEIAIFQHYNGQKVKTEPLSELNELFEALRTQKVTYALVPVENSSAGAVMGAYELLMDYDFRIQAEVILHVHHALMVVPGTKFEDIQGVQSHPQALAQCERYLQQNSWKPIRWYDTAGAAKDLAANKPANTAALATTKAAELYGLEVLAEQVEDIPFNYTRFLLLGIDDPNPGEYNKTSVVFATRNRPSALYDCLGEFASRGLNLTKIESRPRRNRPWEPIFFVDFEGHWQEPNCQDALTRLLQRASFVKMLGSYPAVKTDTVGI
ncbi:MAG: prephenate dehydratase [Anaerolineae bacterium]|nr:prephenate dehydratase [Anaerolineae bacterium]MDQ7034372.1 prephenate dehydratase [Anaerolineae bacterium]